MTKLKSLTKKQLRAFIAVLVALCVAVPSMTALIIKAAETKTYLTELDSDTGAEATLTSTYNGGTVYYYYTPDDRTYTYDLGTTKLVPGDTVSFDDDSKSISWVHDAGNAAEAINSVNVISELMDLNEKESSGDIYVLDLNSEKALTVGTTYYYEAGTTCYSFEVPEYVGYESSGVTASDVSYRDYHMKDYPLQNGENIKITIDASSENVTATLSGNQLTRQTIYIRADTLTNNEVYLLTKATSSGEGLIKYSETANISSGVYDDDCDNYSSGVIGIGAVSHKLYNISLPTITTATVEDNSFFDQDGNSESDIAGKQYINESDQASNAYLESVQVLPEFQAEDYESMGFYLKGYDSNGTAGSQGQYTTNKVLGSIYKDNSSYTNYVHIHDLCEDTNWSWGTTYYHNYGAIWNYDKLDHALSNEAYELNSSATLLGVHNGSDKMNRASNTSSAQNTYLYQLKNVYTKNAVNTTPSGVVVDMDDDDVFEATDVTYTDSSAVAGNNLEIDKTVSTVDKNEGIYDIRLEAYATAESLNLPATDIMMVLDTSKNMTNKLYSREYKNLNTYEGFTEIDLTTGSITHDNLFDRDWNSTWGSVTGTVGNWFAESRDYIHNKYVEDPNAPGTYVYLHQGYSLDGLVNKYTYYFTSCDGTTYKTQTFSQNILGTGISALKISSNGLVFSATGKEDVTQKTIYTLSNYAGKNTDNGSPATNANLYAVHQSSGLFIKDEDGNFRRVYMYKDRMNNGTRDGEYKAGMYRYVIYENDDLANGAVEYEFCTGNTETLNDGTTPAGDYGVFQGFRNYDSNHNLTGNYILSKTLYTEGSEDVTALQAMKESMESFLLNAHKQVAGKGAEAYVGLVAYDKGSEVMYGLKPGSGVSYTDLSKSVGDNSVDSMVATIYNYVVSEYTDSSDNTHKYNVIPANVEHVDDWINHFTGTYAAEIDSGLADAKNQLEYYHHDKTVETTGETIKSRRFAVLFTAGVPAAYDSFLGIDTSGTFTTSTASNAIATAYDIKNDLDTTIYSVGLFDNADEDKINGQYWYYQWSDKVKCSGKTNSYWGGSWVVNGFNNIDPKDAYATNRMLAYISSDYSTPTTLGVTRGTYHPGKSGLIGFLSGGTGYRIDQNYTRNDTGYYLTVSPNTFEESDSTEEQDSYATPTQDVESILNSVFQQLNIATAAPNNTLTTDSFLVDGITNYFDLVTDDSEHMPKAEVLSSSDELDAEKTAALEVIYDDNSTSPSETTKTIAVKEFDYSKYWIGDGNTEDQRKVVLTFRVKRTPGLIGGNSIPTNLSKTAIYDGDSDSITDSTPWGIMEERFEIPKVDLPIEMSHFTQNASMYYGGTKNLEELVDLSDLSEITLAGDNGTLIPNEFVTVTYQIKDGLTTVNEYTVPVGATTGKWAHPIQDDMNEDGTPGDIHEENLEKIYVQPEESTAYTVDVIVTPVNKGTYKEETYNNNEANIYVFNPHYETYNGTVENAGDQYDLTATGKTPSLTEWVYDEVLPLDGVDAEALLNKEEMPSVTYNLNKYNNQVLTSPEEGSIEDTFTVDDGSTVQSAESVAGNLDQYTVSERTDLIMNTIQITAVPVEYTVEQVVQRDYYDSIGVIYKTEYLDENGDLLEEGGTVYYDAEGNVIDQLRDPGTYEDENGDEVAITFDETPDLIYGMVSKFYTPNSVSADTKTTFTNASDGRETGASFTIGLKSHDVTLLNHTTGESGSDYSDPTKKFPLTVSLYDGSTPFEGTIKYTVGTDMEEKTLTFENGVATSEIELADGEYATLKEVRDAYTMTVTSNPNDLYSVLYQAGNTGETLSEIGQDEDEKSDAVTIDNDKTIDITHHIGQIPVTGVGDDNVSSNILIALAAMAALSAGGYGIYRINRAKKETE